VNEKWNLYSIAEVKVLTEIQALSVLRCNIYRAYFVNCFYFILK